VTTTVWTEFFALNVDDIHLVLQRNLKPRRFLFEWRRLKKLVQSSQRDGDGAKKNERRCALGKAAGTGSSPSFDGVTRSIHRGIEMVTGRRKQSHSAGSALSKTSRRSALDAESENESECALSASTAAPHSLCSADDLRPSPKRSEKGNGDSALLRPSRAQIAALSVPPDPTSAPPNSSRKYIFPSNNTPTPGDNAPDPGGSGNGVGAVTRDHRAQSMPSALPRTLRRHPLRVKVPAHCASKSVASALPSTFAAAASAATVAAQVDDAGSWISKMSPFETRHNSERRDQRVLAHTMKTLSVFEPFPKGALARNDSFSDTNSMDRDDLSATEKELSRQTELSRDSLLLSALDPISALRLDREQQRRPALHRRRSRNMGKFGGLRKRNVAASRNGHRSNTPSSFAVDAVHLLGFGGCTPMDGQMAIPTPDSWSEARDAPNLTESRWPSIDLQRQPTTEDDHAINAVEAQLAEDEDANPPPRCFVPTARELSDIMEATTNPLTTSWSTMTGSGDEAAKEMPSGLDFGALEYDGVDGELVTNLGAAHSAHSGDADKETESARGAKGRTETAPMFTAEPIFNAGPRHEDTI